MQIVTPGTSTRAWPSRSISRPCSRAARQEATTNAAEMPPASAYESVRAEISSTMPSVTIEIGSRARNPLAENAAAPGVDRTLR